MTPFQDTLWQHLVEHHDVEHVQAPSAQRHARRLPVAVTGTTAGIAAAIAAAVLLTGGSTTPAYALTPQQNGSYTLTISNLQTAIPQINDEFAKLGINAKAIPVTPTCTAPNDGIPLVKAVTNMSGSITIDNANIPAGTTGFVAAEQTSSGAIEMSMGTTYGAVPSCLNSTMPTSTGTPTN